VAAGLSGPVFVTSPPGDLQRLFVVEFNTGRIKIIKNGSLLPQPFLDIGALVTDNTNFGLLGLAFHPGYSVNGYFYVQYVDNSFRPKVARYLVSADPDVANAASAQLVIRRPCGVTSPGRFAFLRRISTRSSPSRSWLSSNERSTPSRL